MLCLKLIRFVKGINLGKGNQKGILVVPYCVRPILLYMLHDRLQFNSINSYVISKTH